MLKMLKQEVEDWEYSVHMSILYSSVKPSMEKKRLGITYKRFV